MPLGERTAPSTRMVATTNPALPGGKGGPPPGLCSLTRGTKGSRSATFTTAGLGAAALASGACLGAAALALCADFLAGLACAGAGACACACARVAGTRQKDKASAVRSMLNAFGSLIVVVLSLCRRWCSRRRRRSVCRLREESGNSHDAGDRGSGSHAISGIRPFGGGAVEFKIANIDDAREPAQLGEEIQDCEIRAIGCNFKWDFEIELFWGDGQRLEGANGHAGACGSALDHEDKFVHLLVFGNDGLQSGQLLGKRIHFGLQLGAALFVNTQAGNVGNQGLLLLLRGFEFIAHGSNRRTGDVEACSDQDNGEAQEKQRLQRPRPISKSGSHR